MITKAIKQFPAEVYGCKYIREACLPLTPNLWRMTEFFHCSTLLSLTPRFSGVVVMADDMQNRFKGLNRPHSTRLSEQWKNSVMRRLLCDDRFSKGKLHLLRFSRVAILLFSWDLDFGICSVPPNLRLEKVRPWAHDLRKKFVQRSKPVFGHGRRATGIGPPRRAPNRPEKELYEIKTIIM